MKTSRTPNTTKPTKPAAAAAAAAGWFGWFTWWRSNSGRRMYYGMQKPYVRIVCYLICKVEQQQQQQQKGTFHAAKRELTQQYLATYLICDVALEVETTLIGAQWKKARIMQQNGN